MVLNRKRLLNNTLLQFLFRFILSYIRWETIADSLPHRQAFSQLAWGCARSILRSFLPFGSFHRLTSTTPISLTRDRPTPIWTTFSSRTTCRLRRKNQRSMKINRRSLKFSFPRPSTILKTSSCSMRSNYSIN